MCCAHINKQVYLQVQAPETWESFWSLEEELMGGGDLGYKHRSSAGLLLASQLAVLDSN